MYILHVNHTMDVHTFFLESDKSKLDSPLGDLVSNSRTYRVDSNMHDDYGWMKIPICCPESNELIRFVSLFCYRMSDMGSTRF